MKRVIPFSNLRYAMFGLSVLLIVLSVVGIVLRGGFNLGIDFTGGLNTQIQIAPKAFILSYSGVGAAEVDIRGGDLSVSLRGEQEPRIYDLAGFATLSDLAEALAAIPGMQADLLDNDDVSSARILSLTFPVDISEQELIVNMRVASAEDIAAPIDRVRGALEPLGSFSIQVIGRPLDQEFNLKVPAPEEDREFLQSIEAQIIALLTEEFGSGTVILKKTEFVGAVFSEDLIRGAIWSLVVAIVLIMVYVTVRFKFVFAMSAVLALIHDMAIMTGVIGVFQLEVSSATVAAFLTILGYSLNDTIVVFDRIRENTSLMPEADRKTIINTSITQSLSRTTITSLTTLLAVVAIYIFGTGAIKIFAFNLIIGVVVGTYSSIFIASPIVLGWMNVLAQRRRRREGRRFDAGLKLVKPEKSKEEKEAEQRAAREARIVDEIKAAAAQAAAQSGKAAKEASSKPAADTGSRAAGTSPVRPTAGPPVRSQPRKKKKKKRRKH